MMSFFDKNIDEITLEDIEWLKKDEIPESKNLDYKRELDLDNKKREFLIDITSLANSQGGFLIYGVDEKEGKIINIDGIEINNLDKLLQRIENIIVQSIQPKLIGYQHKTIKLETGKYVLILKIPRGWLKPHMISTEKPQFYSRRSVVNDPMDFNEIRNAFLMSEGIKYKVFDFVKERIELVVNKNYYVPLDEKPKFVIHIIPFTAFEASEYINLQKLAEYLSHGYSIINASVRRYNFDGYLLHDYQSFPASSVHQFFRNGIIESVLVRFSSWNKDEKNIFGESFEDEFSYFIKGLLFLLGQLMVYAPYAISLTVLDIEGYSIKFEESWRFDPKKIDSNILYFEPIILEQNVQEDLENKLNQIYDIFWNSAGLSKSPFRKKSN